MFTFVFENRIAFAICRLAAWSDGDNFKKGQTLLIVEAINVMNEVPAPKEGVITEILVANEEVVDYGKGMVRIK